MSLAQLLSLVERIEAGIGSDDADECRDASEALRDLSDHAEEALASLEALRDAIYDASRL